MTIEQLLKDVHGAGYHDAMTLVDPFASQGMTIFAALQRLKEAGLVLVPVEHVKDEFRK